MLLINQSFAEAPVGITIADMFVIQKSSLLTVSLLAPNNSQKTLLLFLSLCPIVHIQSRCIFNLIAAGDWSSCLHHHHHRLWSQRQWVLRAAGFAASVPERDTADELTKCCWDGFNSLVSGKEDLKRKQRVQSIAIHLTWGTILCQAVFGFSFKRISRIQHSRNSTVRTTRESNKLCSEMIWTTK